MPKYTKITGYTDCACRDCFDIAMDGGLCNDCADAGCEHDAECARDDAYGTNEEMETK